MKDEGLNPVLAERMLGEWEKIQDMKFWQYLMVGYKNKRQGIKDDWERMEVGTLAKPLFEKWLRLQGKAHGFKEAMKMPAELAQDCIDIIKGK